MSEYLTPSELHQLTGYARATSQAAWLKEKSVPHRRDGSRVIVSRVHVQSWLEGRSAITTPDYKPTCLPQKANTGLRKYREELSAQVACEKAEFLAARAVFDAGAEQRAVAAQRARSSKRRAVEHQRLAAWADLDAIKSVYRKAIDMTRVTGVAHHVDHIYPLAGKFVSGLHVENNLQVITASENMSKHNTYKVDV